MRTVLFKSNQGSKFYIIRSILYILVIFKIYQTIHSFPGKCEPLLTKFHKSFLYNSEDNNVSRVIFDVYFDL